MKINTKHDKMKTATTLLFNHAVAIQTQGDMHEGYMGLSLRFERIKRQHHRIPNLFSLLFVFGLVSSLLSACGNTTPTNPVTATIQGPITELPTGFGRGGRTVAVDVDPANVKTMLAAGEQGGIFLSNDSGTIWKHLDSLIPFQINDARFVPGDTSGKTILVTTEVDTRIPNTGGIWWTNDSGVTWEQTALPFGCSGLQSGQGIGFVPGSNDLYASTSCGLVLSDAGSLLANMLF